MPHTTTIGLTVLMPCLNESETLVVCANETLSRLERNGSVGEFVIADISSTDGSQQIAQSLDDDRRKRISLKSRVVGGLLLILFGLGAAVDQLTGWASNNFVLLEVGALWRGAILTSLLVMLGSQTVMAGMLLGVFAVDVKRRLP